MIYIICGLYLLIGFGISRLFKKMLPYRYDEELTIVIIAFWGVIIVIAIIMVVINWCCQKL